VTEPPGAVRRVLLDENLPRQLARELPGHLVSTVGAERWSGVLNGALLRRLEDAGFDVFVTADRSLEFQQTLSGRAFAVVVIFPVRVKLEYLLPLVPALQAALAEASPGDVLHVHPPLRAG
jgi:hypothetical protein